MKLLLLLVTVLELCAGAKILFLVPMPSKSHYILSERLIDELAKKGHEVTIIAPFKRSSAMKNVREIVLPDMTNVLFMDRFSNQPDGKFSMRHMSPLNFLSFTATGTSLSNYSLSYEPVKKLINSNEKFDLVIGECFLIESMLAGFGYKFKAPIVGLATFMPNVWANEMVGNPAPTSYIPEPILGYTDQMTFYERLVNFLYTILVELNHYFRHLPGQDAVMREHFGKNAPPLKSLLSKTSLVLVNHHYSFSFPRPYLPNMVEIGSYHVKPPSPLPQKLQKFMDEAKDGVIFFSMGSNLKSSELPKEKFDGIIRILSKLKQRVLWKFEADYPNIPSNVLISKWMPQTDILAHPNLKLFITHGGLLSLTEAILRGVPILGIPIFGDQPVNMKQVEKHEIGLSLHYDNIGTEVMYETITKILNTPKYKENAKYRSTLLKDVPVPQIDLAVYWIEYVIRYKGAFHMISGAQELSWYQLYLIDVYVVLGAIVLVSAMVFITCLKCVSRTLCGKKSNKVESSKKNK